MATRDRSFEVAHFPPAAPWKRETVESLHTLEVWLRTSATMAVVMAAMLPISRANHAPCTVGIASAVVFAGAFAVATSGAREMRLRALMLHPEFAELPAVSRKHRRLANPGGRRALAHELRATAALTRPRCRPDLALVPVLYDRVAAVRPQLLDLAAALEGGRNPDATCVALVRELLRDGRSPLYNPNVPVDQLHALLIRALASLQT